MPTVAQGATRGQAVDDVRPRDVARVADRGQVDRPRSRRAAGGRGRRSRRARPASGRGRASPSPASRACAVLGRELGKVLDARRERLTRGVHGHASCGPRAGPARRHSRRRHRFAPRVARRSSAIRPVHGRVSPYPSRTALPCVGPSADAGRYGAAGGASTRLSTNCAGHPRFVDNRDAATPSRPGCPRTGRPERPADDVDDLVDVLVGLARARRRSARSPGRGPRGAGSTAESTAARSAAVCWRMSTQYSSRSIIRAIPRTCPSIRDRRRTSWALSFE